MKQTGGSNEPSQAALKYTGVVASPSADAVYVRGVVERLDEEHVQHAFVARLLNGEWGHYLIDMSVTAQSVIDRPEGDEVWSLGPEGGIHRWSRLGTRKERVSAAPDGPSRLRRMLDIANIGESVYVVGMARDVYRRVPAGTWTKLATGAEPSATDLEVAGFRSVDGFSEDEIYAVGFEGEIWVFDGNEWRRAPSPTNVRLDDVLCAGDAVTVSGAAGVLLRGRGMEWAALQQDVTRESLWSLASFRDTVYTSDISGVYRIDGDTLSPVEPALPNEITCSYLAANEHRLWSVGSRDIASFDGSTWQVVVPPGQDRAAPGSAEG